MDAVYAMPDQPHRLFLNVVHACPNACLFCVDFKGETFFGFDLKHGRAPTSSAIIDAARNFANVDLIREAYFCGIGEPLLRYDVVVEVAAELRVVLHPEARIAVNTSGTHYRAERRMGFIQNVDLIQVSLNAESEEKYDAICRPKFRGAYGVVLSFLGDLRRTLDRSKSSCRVELSVVDPVDVEHLPALERQRGDVPRPDVEACLRIANEFGWPLKVKRLMRDCERSEWAVFADSIRSRTS